MYKTVFRYGTVGREEQWSMRVKTQMRLALALPQLTVGVSRPHGAGGGGRSKESPATLLSWGARDRSPGRLTQLELVRHSNRRKRYREKTPEIFKGIPINLWTSTGTYMNKREVPEAEKRTNGKYSAKIHTGLEFVCFPLSQSEKPYLTWHQVEFSEGKHLSSEGNTILDSKLLWTHSNKRKNKPQKELTDSK